jgi:hypothetical protein
LGNADRRARLRRVAAVTWIGGVGRALPAMPHVRVPIRLDLPLLSGVTSEVFAELED